MVTKNIFPNLPPIVHSWAGLRAGAGGEAGRSAAGWELAAGRNKWGRWHQWVAVDTALASRPSDSRRYQPPLWACTASREIWNGLRGKFFGCMKEDGIFGRLVGEF